MGKRAWELRRQADQAAAREAFFQNRTPPESADIESRGASTDVFYRSLLLREGTDALIFRTSVPSRTLELVSAADAGLLIAAPTNSAPLRMRGSGLRPTRINWYRGTANPVRRRTAWGSSVARYYDTTGGRSHFSIPFSRATGVFDAGDLTEAFDNLFGVGGSQRALLGTQNGRASITWERASVSAQS